MMILDELITGLLLRPAKITQAQPAHRLKRQQLGEADVSTPQFDRFFYCHDFYHRLANDCKVVARTDGPSHSGALSNCAMSTATPTATTLT